MRFPGLLFTFEGIEGCGKTTQMDLAEASLRRTSYEVFRTREPGGTPVGERIRSVFLAAEHRFMAPVTELMLVEACRAQLVRERIRPELERGSLVLCDRFTDATLAYQGYGRGLDLDLIEGLNRLAGDGIEPDRTFLFDCPVEVGLRRMRRRYQEADDSVIRPGPDRLEAEERAFHERIREGYLAIGSKHGGRIRILDTTREKERVHLEVMEHVWAAVREREEQCPLRKSSDRSG